MFLHKPVIINLFVLTVLGRITLFKWFHHNGKSLQDFLFIKKILNLPILYVVVAIKFLTLDKMNNNVFGGSLLVAKSRPLCQPSIKRSQIGRQLMSPVFPHQ